MNLPKHWLVTHVEKTNMTYVFYPDLPSLPEVPLEPASETFHQYLTISCDKNGLPVPNTVCTRHAINPDVVEWARQNISQEFHAMGLNCQGTSTGGVAIPHTDRTRNWTLMWIIETGGQQVPTVFWQEQGFDVERDPGYYPKNYESLTELETHVFKPNCWVLINAKVIHSVENLQSIRKAVQLGFWDNTDFIRRWTN